MRASSGRRAGSVPADGLAGRAEDPTTAAAEEGSISITEGDLTVLQAAEESRAVQERAEQLRRSARGRDRIVRIGLTFGSLAAVWVAMAVAGLTHPDAASTLVRLALAGVVWLTLVAAFGLKDLNAPTMDEMRRALAASAVATVIALFAGAGGPSLAWGTAALVALELASRWGWRRYLRRVGRDGSLAVRTLVIGTSEDALAVSGLVGPGAGLRAIGRVTVAGDPEPTDDLAVLGSISELPAILGRLAPERVVVASAHVPSDELERIRRLARLRGADLSVMTRIPDTLSSTTRLRAVEGFALLDLRIARLTGPQAMLKRTLDVCGAGLGLLIASPFLALIALAVALTSPGPVLFRQERVTRGGKPFRIIKFRTMLDDADRRLVEREHDPSRPFFKPAEDDLITPVGRVLRKLSLDELPNLWNVVTGDMSLVGPRPLPVLQVQANPELLGPRHDVRAGITGWWQVSGRSDVTPEEAVRQDLFYIENWSLGLDISILIRTIGVLIHRRGAR